MLRPGDSFDKYVVERLLGSGGMGEVYVVHHRRTKKRGALKIVLPHLLTDPTTVERFLQEAQIGARIEDATHIVDVLDAGRDEAGSPWLVMEYLSGRDLGQILDRVRTLEPETLVEVLRQTAEALDSAHAKGVVHRDIKPENLFIQARPGRPNVVKVLDFGIAKILEQATHTGTTAGGTIAYMAPEQGDGRAAVGPRADIWPLGLIAYRALVGTPYWLGESAFAIMKELVADDLAKASERAREQGAVVPLFDHAGDAFDDFFVRCVNRDPEARFATAGGAVTALAAALGVTRRTPLVIPEASASEPTAPPPRPAAESASGAPESAARTAAASETLGPTSTARLQGADVDAEVRGAEARYREERAKRLRLFLKLSVIPALVVAGVSFALWYEGHTTDRARRDAWASFLACALGKVPEKDEAVSELRRRLDLQKTLNRLEGARRGAPLPSSEAKSDLLGCVRYARVVADLVDRASTHAQSFAKQMDALARPADIPNEGVAAALENALDGSSGLGLDGGKVDPKLTPPQLTTAALDMEAPGSQPISANASDDLGTTKLRGGGIRRRTFRTTRSMIVCDFSKAGMDCATYSAPKGSIGAVVSSPPLGDVVLVATDHGLALLPRVGPERPILDLPDLWQGTHAGRDEPRFVRGDPKRGEVAITRIAQGGEEVVERRVRTSDWDDPRVWVAWDKTLLMGRMPLKKPSDPDAPIPANTTPLHVYDEPLDAPARELGELDGYLDLDAGCRSGDTTYLYLYDTSLESRSGLVTWRAEDAPTLRTLPVGGYLDVACDEAGITFSGRLRCPPSGGCVEIPNTVSATGWGGCSDGVTEYAVEEENHAWFLWRGPPGQAPKPIVLADVGSVMVEPPSFACGPGFAFTLIRNKTNTRVVDLTTDPPHML